MEEKTAAQSPKTSSGVFNSIYLWIGIAVVALVGGWMGLNALLSSFETYKMTVVDYPREVIVNNNATFTWRVDGPPVTLNHTSIRLGTESVPGELKTDVKPESTKYTYKLKDFDNGQYGVPLQFVGNIILDKVGKFYFRAYTVYKDKHYWSEEYSMDVLKGDNKVVLINAPQKAAPGNIVSFTWRVDGPGTTINHTSIHYGLVSTPGVLGKEVDPKKTKYTDFVKDFADGKYDIPLQFVGNAKLTAPGTYYFRGHALINGQNYWTDESALVVEK